MGGKLNKNQWVAVASALLVLSVIIVLGLVTSPAFEEFEKAFTGEVRSQSTVGEINYENADKLLIEDLTIGSGEEVTSGKTISVHYTGYLTDGTVFDSSKNRDKPFEFTVGENRVIAGWETGVLGMKEGGIRQLIIPPELGYGSLEVGPIPPNSVLIFEIELLEVKD